jgi:tetratricopeptide (TPR) repeat protein
VGLGLLRTAALLRIDELETKSDQQLERERLRRTSEGIVRSELTYERFQLLCLLRRFPEAEAEVSRAVEEYPEFVSLWILRGTLRLESVNNIPGACSDYARALELEPNYPVAHAGLSRALEALEQHEPAKTEANRAVELSRDATTLFWRGTLCMDQDDLAGAAADFHEIERDFNETVEAVEARRQLEKLEAPR